MDNSCITIKTKELNNNEYISKLEEQINNLDLRINLTSFNIKGTIASHNYEIHNKFSNLIIKLYLNKEIDNQNKKFKSYSFTLHDKTKQYLNIILDKISNNIINFNNSLTKPNDMITSNINQYLKEKILQLTWKDSNYMFISDNNYAEKVFFDIHKEKTVYKNDKNDEFMNRFSASKCSCYVEFKIIKISFNMNNDGSVIDHNIKKSLINITCIETEDDQYYNTDTYDDVYKNIINNI